MGRLNVFILLTLVGLTTGCSKDRIWILKEKIGNDDNVWLDPSPAFLRNLPRGDDSYSQGFRDGCKTTVGIVGPGFQRTAAPIIDGYRMVEDKIYTRGYLDASDQCAYHIDWDTH